MRACVDEIHFGTAHLAAAVSLDVFSRARLLTAATCLTATTPRASPPQMPQAAADAKPQVKTRVTIRGDDEDALREAVACVSDLVNRGHSDLLCVVGRRAADRPRPCQASAFVFVFVFCGWWRTVGGRLVMACSSCFCATRRD